MLILYGLLQVTAKTYENPYWHRMMLIATNPRTLYKCIYHNNRNTLKKYFVFSVRNSLSWLCSENCPKIKSRFFGGWKCKKYFLCSRQCGAFYQVDCIRNFIFCFSKVLYNSKWTKINCPKWNIQKVWERNFLHRKYPTLYDTGHYIQKYIMTTLFITIYQSYVQLIYFNIHRSLHTYRFSLGNIWSEAQ